MSGAVFDVLVRADDQLRDAVVDLVGDPAALLLLGHDDFLHHLRQRIS